MKIISGIKNESDYITKVTQSVREIREALHIFTKQSIKIYVNPKYYQPYSLWGRRHGLLYVVKIQNVCKRKGGLKDNFDRVIP